MDGSQPSAGGGEGEEGVHNEEANDNESLDS